MSLITSQSIYDAVKRLCLYSNIYLPEFEYKKLCELYRNEDNILARNSLKQILENVEIAFNDKRPLCQDTGFVTVFIDIGQNVRIQGESLNYVINKAVEDAYKEYFLRKSIVKSPVERENTNTNTPVCIHSSIVNGDDINIILSVKGGGCENVSAFKMLTPCAGMDGITDFVMETLKNASSKPCPPVRVGIGIGSNFEGSAILSKKALLLDKSSDEFQQYEADIKNKINMLNIGVMGLGGNSTCFDVKILSEACHIASLPVSVSVSCHSSRHAKAHITEDKITFDCEKYDFCNLDDANSMNIINVNSQDIDKIKSLTPDTCIKLSGKIYTARDAAHKKFETLIKNNEKLPFELNNAIIFYAGPCPPNANEVIGPVGPTTSSRMDSYTPMLYSLGLLGTIGKGIRNSDVTDAIKKYGGKYFTITGGVASLLKRCVKSSRIIAYPELGTEAVYELDVENLPLIVKI